uniref:transcriptional regulator n=1 Tax=uncultured Sphingomonas sp. TaxID=158754 RepID=UPI0035CC7580
MEIYTIGEQRFEPSASTLSGPLGSIRLETRSAEVLAALCRRRGEVVSQQDLLDQVWGGRTVSDNSVSIAISDIRRALADDARRPLHVVTIPKRGYRLNVETPQPEKRPIDSHSAVSVTARRRVWIVAGLLFVTLVAIGWWLRTAARPLTLAIIPVRNQTGDRGYDALAKGLDRVIVQDLAMMRGYRVIEGRTSSANETLEPSLTLWAGQPALSLTVKASSDGRVLWSATAEGQPGAMAKLTSAKLRGLSDHVPGS